MDQVIAKLAEVATERRKGKKLPLHEVARHTTVGEDAIRAFEKGTQGKNIDRMASAYADALGDDVSVFDLWDAAIKRAREAAETDADRAARAEAAATTAREETQQARGKSNEQRAPKAK